MANNKKLYGTKSDIKATSNVIAIIMMITIIPILVFRKTIKLLIEIIKHTSK